MTFSKNYQLGKVCFTYNKNNQMAEINIAVYSQVPIRKQIKNTNGIGKSEMSDLIKWAPN